MVVTNILIDLLFMVDCIFVLITTYEKPNGLMETSVRNVVRKNFSFNYLFDLASSFPSFIFFTYIFNIENKGGQT